MSGPRYSPVEKGAHSTGKMVDDILNRVVSLFLAPPARRSLPRLRFTSKRSHAHGGVSEEVVPLRSVVPGRVSAGAHEEEEEPVEVPDVRAREEEEEEVEEEPLSAFCVPPILVRAVLFSCMCQGPYWVGRNDADVATKLEPLVGTPRSMEALDALMATVPVTKRGHTTQCRPRGQTLVGLVRSIVPVQNVLETFPPQCTWYYKDWYDHWLANWRDGDLGAHRRALLGEERQLFWSRGELTKVCVALLEEEPRRPTQAHCRSRYLVNVDTNVQCQSDEMRGIETTTDDDVMEEDEDLECTPLPGCLSYDGLAAPDPIQSLFPIGQRKTDRIPLWHPLHDAVTNVLCGITTLDLPAICVQMSDCSSYGAVRRCIWTNEMPPGGWPLSSLARLPWPDQPHPP